MKKELNSQDQQKSPQRRRKKSYAMHASERNEKKDSTSFQSNVKQVSNK